MFATQYKMKDVKTFSFHLYFHFIKLLFRMSRNHIAIVLILFLPYSAYSFIYNIYCSRDETV